MPRKCHEFTDEEINYIIENWGKESPHSMKKKFGCTWYAISKVAENNGLVLPTSNEWTEEEIETLVLLAEKYHYKKISKIMNKTDNAVYLKARRLGISLIQDRRAWTNEEENYLKEQWGTKSVESIAKNLKRTIFSLKVKAVKMHLGPMIRNNTEMLSVSDIVEILGVSRDRITTTWVKHGLKLKKKRLTKHVSYYFITWEDLLEFLKENQSEWDSRLVDDYMLGEEEAWLIEKRKRDSLENPLWYRRWTEEEIIRAEFLFKIGKSYNEIADDLKRSEQMVAELLRNRGYSYRLAQFWKGSELKYLIDNYQNMTYEQIADKLGRTEKAVSAKLAEIGLRKRLVRSKDDK